MKKLIINADDFGFDADTFEVTTQLIEAGAVSSATILLGCPLTDQALRYARDNAELASFGLHFNIADDVPPLSTEPLHTLVNAEGHYRSPIIQRLRALTGRLSASDIAKEATAQLSFLFDHGVRPTHLDSHGHMHKFPFVLAALRPVLDYFGISRIRLPNTMYDRGGILNRMLDAHCRRAFQRSELLTPDAFFNTRTHDLAWFDRFLASLGPGITELGVHPGSLEAWRAAEARPLTEAAQSGRFAREKISLIDYRALGNS